MAEAAGDAATQISSFNSLFGGEPGGADRRPAAREARPLPARAPERRPRRCGRISDSKGRVRYRLAEPLRVKEGDYVGLTAVTWIPAFAVDLDAAGNEWLASRPEAALRDAVQQQARSASRTYYRRTDAQLESEHGQGVPLHLPDGAAAVLGAHRAGRAAPPAAAAVLSWRRALPSRRPGSPGRTARSAPRGCRSGAVCRSAGCPRVPACRRCCRPRSAGGASGPSVPPESFVVVSCVSVRSLRVREPRSEDPGSGVSSGTDWLLLPPPPSSPELATTTPDDQAGDDRGDAQHDQAAHGGSASAARGRAGAAAVRAVAQVPPDELLAVRADAQGLGRARQVRRAVRGRHELGDDLHPLAGDAVVVADSLVRPRRRRPPPRPPGPRRARAAGIALAVSRRGKIASRRAGPDPCRASVAGGSRLGFP